MMLGTRVFDVFILFLLSALGLRITANANSLRYGAFSFNSFSYSSYTFEDKSTFFALKDESNSVLQCPLLQVLQNQEHDQKPAFEYQLYFHAIIFPTALKGPPLPMHKCTSYNFSKLEHFLHFHHCRYTAPEIGIRFTYH